MEAINIPLQVMENANKCWKSIQELAIHGNIQCISDIQVQFYIKEK